MAQILVIGGGIAGTAAALALTKAGLEVAVYEAHPDSGEAQLIAFSAHLLATAVVRNS